MQTEGLCYMYSILHVPSIRLYLTYKLYMYRAVDVYVSWYSDVPPLFYKVYLVDYGRIHVGR